MSSFGDWPGTKSKTKSPPLTMLCRTPPPHLDVDVQPWNATISSPAVVFLVVQFFFLAPVFLKPKLMQSHIIQHMLDNT